MLRSDTGTRLFLFGTVAALAGFSPVLGRVAAGLGARFALRRPGSPTRLIGSRWVAAHPAVLARASAAVVVTLGLLSQSQLFMTALSEESRAAATTAQRLDGRLLQIVLTVPLDAPAGRRFTAALAPDDRVLVIDIPDSGAPPVVRAPCRDLAALARVVRCPDERPRPAAAVFAGHADRVAAFRWIDPRGTEFSTADTGGPGFLRGARTLAVVTADGDVNRVKEAAYRSLAAPGVRVPGEEYVGSGAAMARTADWVLLVAGAGFILLLLTGAVSLLGTFLDRAEDLRPLAGWTSGFRFHLGVAWWGVGAPLGCAVLLSTFFVTVLALLNAAFIYWGTQRPPFGLLGVGALVALALCAAATAAGAVLSSRFTHRWAPRGD